MGAAGRTDAIALPAAGSERLGYRILFPPGQAFGGYREGTWAPGLGLNSSTWTHLSTADVINRDARPSPLVVRCPICKEVGWPERTVYARRPNAVIAQESFDEKPWQAAA